MIYKWLLLNTNNVKSRDSVGSKHETMIISGVWSEDLYIKTTYDDEIFPFPIAKYLENSDVSNSGT